MAFQSCSILSNYKIPAAASVLANSVPAKVMKLAGRTATVVAVQRRCRSCNFKRQVQRRTANYEPSSWDFSWLQSQGTGTDSTDKLNVTHIERLKEEVQRLMYKETELVVQLEIVDALQNLGLAYHFQKEIKNVLGSIQIENACLCLAEDLHATALLFRLLREHGFQVSQDMFNAFKDDEGHFKECICKDHQGMLSLYEASHLAFEGEGTLDDAKVFTTNHLKKLKSRVYPQLKEKVDRALELPSHWRIPRLDVKCHIAQYEKEGNLDPVLLQLAKLDFNKVQSTHIEELERMTWWWKNLGVAKRLPFARDRLVECFCYAAGVVSDPKLGYCREEITKVCNLITTVDDVYDIYGSMEELILFTDAVNKWDFSATERFPDYLKFCYSVLYDTTNEIADNIQRRDGRDVLLYLKRAWADLCTSFLVEAKWQSTGYFPTLEEYLENGWISASGHVILTHVFCLSRQTTKETMQCLKNYPKVFRSSSTIFRLCNDLAASAADIARGAAPAPTSVLCYMHEHGVTEEIAREEIKKPISETWKILNKEVADCDPIPRSLAITAMDLARMSHFTYHKGDGIGAPDKQRKNHIKSTFLEPIKIRERNARGLVDDKLVF